MKTLKKSILLLTSFVMAMSAASCVNNELTEPEEGKAVKELATIDEQVASMEATVADLEALQTSAEGLEDELAGVVSSLESHIADLKAGAPLLEGTLATLAQQKKLAELIGTIEAGAEPTKAAALTKAVASIDKGAGLWLGKHFDSYYPAVKAEAAAKARIASFDFKSQQILVEGVLSDVDAGLRKGFDAKELATLASGIEGNAEQAEKLSDALSALTAEVEAGYTKAVETAVEDPADFDLSALRQLNSSVAKTLADADNSLAGLIARVEACETQLADIKSRLGELETEIEDLQGLLDLIQSVTFMSEYSAEKAFAYYTLGSTSSREDGKKSRTPQETMELTFVVRPASASAALAEASLWNKDLKVFGYYAQTITKAAPEMFDFNITNVEADGSGSGIVTVSVASSALDEAFWFKEKGAKLALSIATGKTDLTSGFVEVMPKDASGTVYVESLELSAYTVEIDNGESTDLDAYVTPDNATEGSVIWTTSNADVLTVSENGVIEGKSVGTAVITATTKGIDEWGNTISAQCAVKVNPAVKLVGPSYVEEGATIQIRVESPDYINPDYISWEIEGIANPSFYASVTPENGVGVITGKSNSYDTGTKTYNSMTVKCTIDGAIPIELSHELRVIVAQPKGIEIEGMDYSENTLTLKKGQNYTFNSSIRPASVDMNYFRLLYQSNYPGVVRVPTLTSGYVVAENFGTATIDIIVSDSGQYNYFYPARENYKRTVTVTVEPYWVTGITLPSTWEMKPGDEVTLQAEFTSDGGDGVQPEDKTLTWMSDNTDVVEVDPSTGKMTAKAAGTANVKATTSGSLSVPSGTVHKSASCVVKVKEATATDPKVGDYYYSDGTWGNDATRDDIIGVIFSIEPAIGTDVMLRNQYPACSNGLVISTIEYNENMGCVYYQDTFFKNNSYDLSDDSNVLGFTYTYYMTEYAHYKGDGLNYGCHFGELFRNDVGVVAKHTKTVSSPASPWYVPSCAEMKLLYEVKASVNASLAAINGNQISDVGYWMSNSVRLTKKGNYWDPDNGALFNMGTNSLDSVGQFSSQANCEANHPVRVVLAF